MIKIKNVLVSFLHGILSNPINVNRPKRWEKGFTVQRKVLDSKVKIYVLLLIFIRVISELMKEKMLPSGCCKYTVSIKQPSLTVFKSDGDFHRIYEVSLYSRTLTLFFDLQPTTFNTSDYMTSCL